MKARAYGADGSDSSESALPEGTASARAALELALSTLHRLFAPFLPFTCEEVWSWWMQGSVHRSPWPESAPIRALAGDESIATLAVAAEVLGELRGAKSAAKVSMRNPIERATVTDSAERLERLARAAADVCDAGRVDVLGTTAGDSFTVDVVLGLAD